jgi:hypothetical protein
VAAHTDRPFWFQLYVMRDRAFIDRLIDRANGAGNLDVIRAVRLLVVLVPALGLALVCSVPRVGWSGRQGGWPPGTTPASMAGATRKTPTTPAPPWRLVTLRCRWAR